MKTSYKIRDKVITPNLVLSPMAGVTDSIFRRLIKHQGGVGLVVTEFLSIEGMTRGGQNCRTRQMMKFWPEEHPIAIQIFGADSERMAQAAVMVEEEGADFVDINCGCPARKVVGHGGGSSLLRNPELLEEILRKTVKAVSIPVTLKIRAGWDADSINCVEIARLAEDCGIEAIALHGRTRVQAYSGEADWSLVRAIKEAVKIPVSGSGDVRDVATALRRFEETGCDAIHIGRGAMYNPWLFRQIVAEMMGDEPYRPSLEDKRDLLLHFLGLMLEAMPNEVAALGKMKQLCGQFTRGLPNGTHFREEIFHSHRAEEIRTLINRYFDGLLRRGRVEFEEALIDVAELQAMTCEA